MTLQNFLDQKIIEPLFQTSNSQNGHFFPSLSGQGVAVGVKPTLAHSPSLKPRRSSAPETRPLMRRLTAISMHWVKVSCSYLLFSRQLVKCIMKLTFFVTCLEQASRVRQIPVTVLWKYWMSTLMFTLQSLMAQGIIERSSEIYGRRFKETYETFEELCGTLIT